MKRAFSEALLFSLTRGSSPEISSHVLQLADYAAKYRQSGKKIFLMGINFDPEQRNLAKWLVREDG